jgi:hypothetical protein
MRLSRGPASGEAATVNMTRMICVFCGADGQLTKEHIWPAWLQPYLETPGERGTTTRTIIRAEGVESESSFRSRPATATVKSICAECNNGWMSELEGRAKGTVLRMVQGRRRVVLGAEQIPTVAAWAMKTA